MESELALINKVELRIALAADDAQLENALKVYLTPVLLKLASPHGAVRTSILKIIQNIIPRILASPTLKLPVQLLLEQVLQPRVSDTQDPSQVRLYSLLFVLRGVDRLNAAEKLSLVPQIVAGMSLYPRNVSARLFHILCKVLSESGFKAAARDGPTVTVGPATDADLKFISRCIAKLLLLQPIAEPCALPGLSLADTTFLTRDAGVTYRSLQEISQAKAALLEFLKANAADKPIFEPILTRIPLLIASCDPSLLIRDPSEILFRKLALDLEDAGFIDELFKLVVGDSSSGVLPVSLNLQEKIISLLLCKSKQAALHLQVSQVANLGFASDNARLKQATVQFVRWVSRRTTADEGGKSVTFTTDMASHLRQSLLDEGWPKLDASQVKNYSNAISQRQLKYEALGELLKLNPQLLSPHLDPDSISESYLGFLFGSLEGDDVGLRSTIQDALSSLTVHLPGLETSAKDALKTLLFKYFTSTAAIEGENLQSCRYVALKFVNCCFPFNDNEARLICILGTDKENRSDIIEEATKGLHPHWFSILQSSNTLEFKSTLELLGTTGATVVFPEFDGMVHTIHEAYVNDKEPLIKTMGQAVNFAVSTLVMQAIKGKSTVVVVNEEWSTRIDKALEVDEVVQTCVKKEIESLTTQDEPMGEHLEHVPSFFEVFVGMVFEAFAAQQANSGYVSDTVFGSTLTRLLSLTPTACVCKLSSMTDKLLELVHSKVFNDLTLTQTAQATGIVASSPSVEDSKVLAIIEGLSVLWPTTSRPSNLERTKLVANCYLISRLAVRGRIETVLPEILTGVLSAVIALLSDVHSVSIGLECISQLTIHGVLSLQLMLGANLSKYLESIQDEVIKRVKKSDEKAVIVLSHLSLARKHSIKDDFGLTIFEQAVYETHVSKQTEFMFSSGESFAILAAGWESTVLRRQLDINDSNAITIIESLVGNDTSRLPVILDMVIKSCANTKPSLKRSACIWLLSLVQFCGHLEPVKENAARIHVSFMRFLADRDELIQELASRGLSLVYEMGDLDLKDTLVKGLLKSFTDTTSNSAMTAGSVEHDTELFDKDVLNTHDGSVSTYKDVLNLASDVGDPSLVYKFMSLAKSSALWSSRKGMAFGLGSILSKTSLDEMLVTNKNLATRLIPKLYRYRFDPGSSVSKSMQDIWNVLVKDSTKTINENFKNILAELLKGMGNKEWRVRQALTTALIDLVQVVTLKAYEDQLEEIWSMSFRAMDDIKESVRKEGNKLTRSLAATITRRIQASTKADAGDENSGFLETLLPFLLGTKGLLSDADDIRDFALTTVLKLVKEGGASIRPFIPELIDNFIALMSTLEPQIVNYLVLNADKYNLRNDDIDAKRLQSVGQSPMMDAIEQMLLQLDDTLMPIFISKLQQSIKKSIGLPLKVCGSKVLVTLVTKHLELVKPYGDKLLQMTVLQINDRNDVVASSYAAAAGYLCRICSLESILKYSELLKELYFEFESDKNRIVASIASESVAKYSRDKFELVASSFLPLAFIGKHDPLSVVKSNFEREWIENTSGNLSIKLYLSEIVDLSRRYLLSSRLYEVKQIIAKAVADAVNSVEGTAEFSDGIRVQIFDLLLEGSKGKSWSGKEFILKALILFAIKCKDSLLNDEVLLQKVESTISTEIKRRNKSYQKQAIIFASEFIYNFSRPELTDTFTTIFEEIISDPQVDTDESDDSDGMEVDSNLPKTDKAVVSEEHRLKLIASLFSSFNPEHGPDNALGSLVLSSIEKLFNSSTIVPSWRSKSASCEHILNLITNHGAQLNKNLVNLIYEDWKILSQNCLGSREIDSVKINFIRLSALVMKLVSKERSDEIRKCLLDLQNTDISSVVATELQRIL
jgi:proteasome component ECM29